MGLLMVPIFAAAYFVRCKRRLQAIPRMSSKTPVNMYISPMKVRKKERRMKVSSEWNFSIDFSSGASSFTEILSFRALTICL